MLRMLGYLCILCGLPLLLFGVLPGLLAMGVGALLVMAGRK